jgi:hypothetical protein
MTKTKIALAAVLFAATSSAALAEDGFDPNLANRYPGYAASTATSQTFQTAAVSLQQHRKAPALQQRDVALPANSSVSTGQNEFDIDRFDRASSPYAGGGVQ